MNNYFSLKWLQENFSQYILVKFSLTVLFALSLFMVLFCWYIKESQTNLIHLLQENRTKYINEEFNRNKTNAINDKIKLISKLLKRNIDEISKSLFYVDYDSIKLFIQKTLLFDCITRVMVYDLMVDEPFVTAIKKNDKYIFQKTDNDSDNQDKFFLVDIYRKYRKIGYIKISIDHNTIMDKIYLLQINEINNVKEEFAYAKGKIKKLFIHELIGIFIIFAILLVIIYIPFDRIILKPLKNAEYNLQNFLNILQKKTDSIHLIEPSGVDEFGRINRFINLGIKTSLQLHKQQEEDAHQIMRLATVVEQASQSIVITDTESNIEYVNPAFFEHTGYTEQDVLGRNPRIIASGLQDKQYYEELWNTLVSGKTWHGVFINKKKDGSRFHERATIFPIRDSSGKTINYAAIKEDITNEIKLEKQFHQAQKMESIGTLAGGIAHDFNNLLTVINGYAEMILFRLNEQHAIYSNIQAILDAGLKAKQLTTQLLAFSRKQVYNPRVISINDTIQSLNKMLDRLIDDDISIDLFLRDNLSNIKADPAQIEQILLNLVINSRDALRAVSQQDCEKKITIETGMFPVTEEYVKNHAGARIGNYAFFAVSDNGTGMDKPTKERIFEPFFTTKEQGSGTGLGLAMIYGIVKQNKGNIYVYSEPDIGTTFKIYWPTTEETDQGQSDGAILQDMPRGKETLLFVEDNEKILNLASQAFSLLGYQIYCTRNGAEALEVIRQNPDSIDLIVTDLVMPVMNGKELIREVKKIAPSTHAIYVSGYTDNHIVSNGMLDKGIIFVQKPYSMDELSKIIRNVLDNSDQSEIFSGKN